MSKNPTTKRWDDEISFGDEAAPAAPPAPPAPPSDGDLAALAATLIAGLQATTTPEAAEAESRRIVRETPIGRLHREDPLRAQLRAAYQAHLAQLRQQAAPAVATQTAQSRHESGAGLQVVATEYRLARPCLGHTTVVVSQLPFGQSDVDADNTLVYGGALAGWLEDPSSCDQLYKSRGTVSNQHALAAIGAVLADEDMGQTIPDRRRAAAPAPAVEAAPTAPTPSGLSIEQALTNVQRDAATGTVNGSLRDGTMRGVGFSSADGYVTALANGVKRATGEQYLQVLRSSYGYTDEQIAGLTIAPWLDAPTGKPSGAGVTVDARVEVDGKKLDGIQLARKKREAAAAKVRATADAATLALAQQLAAREDSPTAVWTIGWRGAGSLTRGEIEAAVGEAPEGKAKSTQLARAVETLKGRWDYTKVASGVPAHVTVRWQIGRGEQHAAEVGEAYGEVKAIIDLVDGKIEGTGSADIIDHVREEYQRRVDEEVLQPADITRWLQTEILPRYGAVEDGHDYLVPPQHRNAARAWFNRFAAVWPSASWKRGGLQTEPDGTPRIVNGRPVPELGRLIDDVASVLGGVFVGLEGEIDEQERLWQRTVAEAAKKNPDGLVGARACATALERLDGEKAGEGLIAKLETSRALLGDGPVKVLLDRARALRKAVAEAAAANDDTAQRFANLEIGR